MTAIWGADPGGQWKALTPAAYPAEAALHDLVQEAPQLLPLAGSPRLTVLGREVRLGNGYADLIAVESTGRLVIIEVKLAGNAESRQAVVAQVLWIPHSRVECLTCRRAAASMETGYVVQEATTAMKAAM